MNKRSRTRYGKRLFVKYGRDSTDKIGFTGDLSATGLFIKTSAVYRPGTEIHVEITLPDQKTINIRGKVMWAKQVPPSLLRISKKSGMGVQVTKADSDYYAFLELLSA